MLRLSTPFARRSSAVLLGAALTGSVIVASPAHAAEKPAPVEQAYAATDRGLGVTLKPGPILASKYHFADEHLGFLTVKGRPGICYDYGAEGPDGTNTSGPIAGVPAGKTRDRMQWIANRYWTDAQKSDNAAAAYKSAINRLRSAEFRSDWAKSYVAQLKPGHASVITLSNRMLADSAKFAGPAKVSLTFSKPAPGGVGIALAKVTQAGNPLPGAAVKWSTTGASITTAGKTSAKDGTAKLRFTRGAGAVSIKASASVPEWREAGYSIPTDGRKQHLIRGGFSASVSAGGKFDSLPGVAISSACDGACAGKPPVTFSAKASSSPVRWQATVGGKVLKTLELGAGKSGSATFTGTDGQSITFRYAVKVGGTWSAYRTAKTFDVVCPAWPAVVMTKACACKGGGKATYTFTSPGGIRLYDVVLNGQTERISGTQSVTLAVVAHKGTSVVASFAAYDKAGKGLGSGVLDAWTQD